MEDSYELPCSLEYRCLDRFSIVENPEAQEDEAGNLPFWAVFTELLSSPVSTTAQLVELLDTIAVTLRGSSGSTGDFGLLKHVIEETGGFFETCWPAILRSALDLPNLFPAAKLPILKTLTPELKLSSRQAASLVAHQFLCTLSQPSWKDDPCFDLGIWFNSEQRHQEACKIYLNSTLKYFIKIGQNASFFDTASEGNEIIYSLNTSEGYESPPDAKLGTVEVVLVDEYETTPLLLGLPAGAAVISANRFIGFGQSATQEEIHVGCSPAAYPAVLVTPPLKDDQVLAVRGAEAMVNIVGQRRLIRESQGPEMGTDIPWSQRVMLFMDALEIDMQSDEGGLPDLQKGNFNREVDKAALALSTGSYTHVNCPLWGCGAFGGDPAIKVMALWCAASIAGTHLRIICDPELHGIGRSISDMIKLSQLTMSTVEDIRSFLQHMPKHVRRLETFQWMDNTLRERDKS